jgi:hypothetical protein
MLIAEAGLVSLTLSAVVPRPFLRKNEMHDQRQEDQENEIE